MSQIMIAKATGLPRVDGRRVPVRKGITTADSSHPIVRDHPHLWQEIVPDYPAPAESQVEALGQVIPSGGGWYEVVVGGEVRDKVRGEAAAKARVEELAGVQSWDHVAG